MKEEKSILIKEVEGFWRCDICHRQFEHNMSSLIYSIEGYPEMFCEKCYNAGTMWAIKQAWKEKCRENLT